MDEKKSAVQRIGILTSGGDAPGMNAAVRAVVRAAISRGINCLGIRRGYNGLINGDVFEMDARSVDGLQTKGGTILYTARSMEFKTPEGQQRARDICKYMGIDGLVVIGGDGTFRGARDIARGGVCTVGIPATIDNDIPCTDYTLGFDTACNTAIENIDRLRDTMQSHERCSVVEVMGHESGNLALYVGVACGATAILIPEQSENIDEEILPRIQYGRIHGRNHHIVIVAEGVRRADEVAKMITDKAGIETRVTVLGHVQRGGVPNARDRVMAVRMGCHAVDVLAQGKTNRVICADGTRIFDRDIEEALAIPYEFDKNLFDISRQTVL